MYLVGPVGLVVGLILVVVSIDCGQNGRGGGQVTTWRIQARRVRLTGLGRTYISRCYSGIVISVGTGISGIISGIVLYLGCPREFYKFYHQGVSGIADLRSYFFYDFLNFFIENPLRKKFNQNLIVRKKKLKKFIFT